LRDDFAFGLLSGRDLWLSPARKVAEAHGLRMRLIIHFSEFSTSLGFVKLLKTILVQLLVVGLGSTVAVSLHFL